MYDKFMCYCEGNTKGMSDDAQAAKEKIQQLTAEIQELSAKKKQTDQELVDHKKDRENAKQSLADATSVRNQEHEAYMKESGDSQQNIDALNAAVNALEKGIGAKMLIQAKPQQISLVRKIVQASTTLDGYEAQNVLAFLSEGGPYGDYQSSGGEIVGILKEMKDQMDRDLGGIVSTEEAAQKAFNDLRAAKEEEIKVATEAIETKTVRTGELAVAVVNAKNDLSDTQKELTDNERFLANLAISCEEKTKEWNTRTKLRNEELTALAEVIKMISGDDQLDLFKRTMASPKTAFLQDDSQPRAQKALSMINAVKDGRMSLITYALQMKKVSFAKVLKMIDDMVANLKTEQKDDDEQLGWCEKNLREQGLTAKELNEKIEGLVASMDEKSAAVENLKSEIADLEAEIAQLNKEVAEATQQRKEENASYTTEQADLAAAKQVIEKALNRLNKFYNPNLYVPPRQRELTEEERIAVNSGEVDPRMAETPAPITDAQGNIVGLAQVRPHGFMQAAPPPPPETWSGDLQKKDTSGVTALIQNLIKELETSIKENEMDEQTAQANYEKLMADAKATLQSDSKSITDKQSAAAELEAKKQADAEEHSSKSNELVSTKELISATHGQCDFLMNNFDVRKTARSNEIDALRKGKAVLSGAGFSLLQKNNKEDPAPEAEAANEMTKDLEVNFNKIAPFGKEDTAHELQSHASKTQDMLVDAVENAEVAEIKRAVFRALTRLRAATIKEFDTIARLETQAIDAYNDAHHYRAENPLTHLHEDEAPVETDKLKSFH